MIAEYQTREGDTLDWICWRHYGRQSGAVEIVLEANRRLADLGPVLPAGLVIRLPDLPAPEATRAIELWT
jgi:phage tail protein X